MKIKVMAFDHNALDKCVGDIVSNVLESGGKVEGPIPMPTTHKRYVVNRSPHIDKKSREVLFIHTHCRLLYVHANGSSIVFQNIKDISIPSGIGIKVQIIQK